MYGTSINQLKNKKINKNNKNKNKMQFYQKLNKQYQILAKFKIFKYII